MTTRRGFLLSSAGAAGYLGLHAAGLRAGEAPRPAEKPLKILVLGGTGFIGPKQVRQALDRGHEITIFNRGNRSGLFGDEVEELIGNRDSTIDNGLEPLMGDRTWDAVIDNSGYVPRHVRESVELLRDRCKRYLYISTVAVYDPEKAERFAEDGPLNDLPDPSIEDVTGTTYGPLKAECDRIVRAELGDKATVVRPSFIVGPGDTTDRFTYWVERIHKGGPLLAPSRPEKLAQWVDVRDLCAWIVDLLERDVPGTFNAAGPAAEYTREGLLWGIAAQVARDFEFVWATDELLGELKINTPMMFPGPVTLFSENEASRLAGMHYRPLADTVKATHEWWAGLPEERRAEPRGWPTAEQEAQAIERLRG